MKRYQTWNVVGTFRLSGYDRQRTICVAAGTVEQAAKRGLRLLQRAVDQEGFAPPVGKVRVTSVDFSGVVVV
jgi:hypothetical protein